MTTKQQPTIDYARDFYRRLDADRHTRYVIGVEAHGHMPRMVKMDQGRAWMESDPEHVVGIYKGTEDLTPQDIADAIDHVDPFVPRAYRVES